MLEGFLNGLVDKEQVTKDYMTDALERVAKEFKLGFNEIAFMVRPGNEDFDFKVYAVKLENSVPKGMLREVTIKEIVTPPEDE